MIDLRDSEAGFTPPAILFTGVLTLLQQQLRLQSIGALQLPHLYFHINATMAMDEITSQMYFPAGGLGEHGRVGKYYLCWRNPFRSQETVEHKLSV